MIKLNRTVSAAAEPFPTVATATPTDHDTSGATAGELEPAAEDLKAIEAEWPLIAAELTVLDAEIAVLCSPHGQTELDWRRLRRARDQVLRQAAALASRDATRTTQRRAA